MAAPHSIVVIGASYGGLPIAHGLLKDVLPKIKGDKQQFKLTLINPTDEFYWKVGAPRTIANPQALPVEKAILKFTPTFEKYGDKFEFIQAYATNVEPTTRIVSLSNSASVPYDTLIIASGSKFATDIWSTSGGSEKLRAALKDVHDKLPSAETILIAGGGAAGVETAGEFGDAYGKKKEITLLSGSPGLLNRLNNKGVGKDAQTRLEKQGVKVINDSVRITEHKEEGGKYVLTLSNGETKTVDIFIDATGDKPNSDFLPATWLDDKKKVKTDPGTLRVDVEGVNGVYAIGTVASYSDGSILDTKFAIKPLLATLQNDLEGKGMLLSLLPGFVLMCSQKRVHELRTFTKRCRAICSLFLSDLHRELVSPWAGDCLASSLSWPSRRTS